VLLKDDKRPKKSLSHFFVLKSMTIVLPLLCVLLFSSIAFTVMNINNIKKSYKDTLSIYVNKMDDDLYSAEKFLKNIIANNDYFDALQSTDKNIQYIALNNLHNYIKKNSIFFNNIIDFFFIYNPEAPYYASHYTNASENKIILMEFIQNRYKNINQSDYNECDIWSIFDIEGNAYLLRTVETNGIYIGAVIFVDSRLKQLEASINKNNMFPAFVDSSNKVYSSAPNLPDHLSEDGQQKKYRGNDGKNYTVINEEFTNSNSQLYFFIKNNYLMIKEAPLLWLIVTMTLISLILIPIFFVFISRSLINPIYHMINVMNEAKNDNLAVRISEESPYKEMDILYSTFNTMIIQIDRLQKLKLRFLQQQTHPHFLLNGLNTIYQLSAAGKNDKVKNFTFLFIKHLRFMLNLTGDKISIDEELDFIRNYTEIQKQRLPYKIEYSVIEDSQVLERTIPPYTIFNFVENIFKYGLSEDNTITINIEIKDISINGTPATCLMITDRGKGFSEDVIRSLENSDDIIDSFGNIHTGIKNVISRINILYGEKASVKIKNLTVGSRVTITIPYDMKE